MANKKLLDRINLALRGKLELNDSVNVTLV